MAMVSGCNPTERATEGGKRFERSRDMAAGAMRGAGLETFVTSLEWLSMEFGFMVEEVSEWVLSSGY